jgi:hypothetical protein
MKSEIIMHIITVSPKPETYNWRHNSNHSLSPCIRPYVAVLYLPLITTIYARCIFSKDTNICA